MEKFYLKNGKEVQIGDIIMLQESGSHPIIGEINTSACFTLTREILENFIKEGIITFKVEDDDSGVPQCLSYYIYKLAKRIGWRLEKTFNYLNTIDKVYPAAAFSMILREVAIELDKKYEDHIENSPEIYVISMLNGRITKANKAHIKNYRNFAAFRSVEDAKFACSVTREILKEMFKSGK